MAALTLSRPAALLLAGLLSIAAPAWPSDSITGYAVVIDGDTLKIGTLHIRLYGIDAPEKQQACQESGREVPCGKRAAEMLAEILEGQTVTCTRQPGRDRYRRMIARCTTAAGDDIGAAMVRAG